MTPESILIHILAAVAWGCTLAAAWFYGVVWSAELAMRSVKRIDKPAFGELRCNRDRNRIEWMPDLDLNMTPDEQWQSCRWADCGIVRGDVFHVEPGK